MEKNEERRRRKSVDKETEKEWKIVSTPTLTTTLKKSFKTTLDIKFGLKTSFRNVKKRIWTTNRQLN